MFFFGSLIPTFFLDSLGRRRPMMWGSAGLALSMMLISVLLSFSKARGYAAPLATATSSASVAFFFTVSFFLRSVDASLFADMLQYMFIFGSTANCIPCMRNSSPLSSPPADKT